MWQSAWVANGEVAIITALINLRESLMRITLLWLSLTLGCGALMVGCGQKGPLFMPGDPNPPAAPR